MTDISQGRWPDMGAVGKRRQVGWLTGLALAFLALGIGAAAHATGFFINQQSVRALGRADAGEAAAAEDPATVFFNPAGMTELWRNADTSLDTFAETGLSLIIPHSQLTNTGSTAITPGSGGMPVMYSGDNASNPGRISPVGDAYLVRRLQDGQAYIGLGLTTPFGLAGEYHSEWFGRYDSLKSKLWDINIGPVVAFPINQQISVGGGIDIQYEQSIVSLAIPNPLTPGGPTAATDGHLDIRGSSWAVGYNAGILFKPAPWIRIGVHYRSAMDHQLEGTASTTGFTGPFSGLDTATGATATSKLPSILSSGIAYEATPKLTLLGGFSWYGWDVVGPERIQFANGSPDAVFANQYRNTYDFNVGAEYLWNDQLTLRAGFMFDRTPTEDQFRATSFADANRYWLAAGASYALSSTTSIDLAIVHVLEDATSVNVTRTFFDGTPLASAVNIRSAVQSNVTTVAAGLTLRF